MTLPPIPGPTLASEGVSTPRMARTVDFSASMFDFRTVVAICARVFPAWAAIKLPAKLAISYIMYFSVAGRTLPGRS